MKLSLVVALAVTVGALAYAQQHAPSAGVHVDPGKVAEALAKGGTLVTRPDLIVQGSHRDKSGQVEVHDKETDVIHILEGDATFVFGGTMVGGKIARPDQWLGTDITGGETHRVAKGDVFVVPAGVPHWFKEVPKSVSYFVVKVIK
jgi:mannose-6-phosphate isomerase-like protein (cupin superfamily)